MKAWIVWLCTAISLSAGCASHDLRCDGRLQSINAPATSPGTTRNAPDTRGHRAE